MLLTKNTIVLSTLALARLVVTALSNDDHDLALLYARQDVSDAHDAYVQARDVYDALQMDVIQARELNRDCSLQRRGDPPGLGRCGKPGHTTYVAHYPDSPCPRCKSEKAGLAFFDEKCSLHGNYSSEIGNGCPWCAATKYVQKEEEQKQGYNKQGRNVKQESR